MSKEEVGSLPPQELTRVLTHGLRICITPPRKNGGLEYVAALQSALKRAYPRVSVTHIRGPQSDWVIFYHPTPASDLFPEDERDELMAAARASHGLPAIGSVPSRKIPEAKVAAVKAALCSTDSATQLRHRVDIGTDIVEGDPRHRTVPAVPDEQEETRVGLLLSVAACGNKAEVQIGASTTPVTVVGTSEDKKINRSLQDQRTKLRNERISVKTHGRQHTVDASDVRRALESDVASLLAKAADDYKLLPPPSTD